MLNIDFSLILTRERVLLGYESRIEHVRIRRKKINNKI
jgi:hypothetical protein